jgi:hypothetical protein
MDQHEHDNSLLVEFSLRDQEIEDYNFTIPGGVITAFWIPGHSRDEHPGKKTNMAFKNVKATHAVGIELLNGFEQELAFEQVGDNVVVHGLLVRDTPLLVRLEE